MILDRCRFPIGAQLLLSATLAMVIGGLVGFRLIAQAAQDAAFAEAQRSLKNRLQTLAQARFPLTRSVLVQLHDLTQDHYIFLSALETLSTFSDGSAPVPRVVEEARAGFGVWRDVPEIRLGDVTMIGNQPYRPSVTKIHSVGLSDPGILIVWTPDDAWQSSFAKAQGQAMSTAGLVGVFLGLGAIALAHFYARRLRRLAHQARKIQEGDFSPMPVRGWRDEITTLGAAINQMASRLESLLARDRAAERLRLLSQVSAGLIHEVKNSLAGARLALQLYQLDPKQESEALEMALQQLSTIEETLARFLHADGTLPWNPESILLADCVAHAMTAAKNRATHLGVSVQFEPRSTTPVHADPRLIIHAIGNLINNALDAAGPNGEVRVEITETENFQHVIVRDNGSGIDPQLAPRLGEPFTSGKDAGVGLGLTVVKGIADRAGGSLQWHRRDDGWTEFILAIPVPSHSTKT